MNTNHQVNPPLLKNTTIILALFLGTFGAHRFYLKQYWRGILCILFSWTFIPTIISIIDVIIFAIMSEKKFNEKYNTLKAKTCSGCENPLTFMSTPNFGGGKLNDGGRVCRKCFKKMTEIDIAFGINSAKKYNTHLVRKKLEEAEQLLFGLQEKSIKKTKTFTQASPVNQQKTPHFSHQYYTLLKELSNSTSETIQKLQKNQDLLKQLENQPLQTTAPQFIANCVIYDMIQVYILLGKDKLPKRSLEAMGLILVVYPFLPETTENPMERDFETLEHRYLQGLYENIVQELIAVGESQPPMQVSINEMQDEKIISEILPKNKLCLPAMLKISHNPLFDEYATLLYQYATVISKADNTISAQEEVLLKEVYQITHHPIPEKVNNSLNISKNNNNESIDEVLAELNALIGLNDVKTEINSLINFIKVQKARETSGLKSSPMSYHIVFTGNPGTGKTTVARIIAKIYKHLGILSEGQLVETDRSGLVAEYVGQTAIKVNKTVDTALNGVLFIDEAYSLVGENKDDFGKEAVATLIKRMEDSRDKLVVILAGYTQEMTDFINTNPGFKSRFNRYINFPDYTPNELFEIFQSKCNNLHYTLTQEAQTQLKHIFEKAYSSRDNTFGNGRFVRNIFEKTLEKQANRIIKEPNLTKEILATITEQDIAEIMK